MFVLILLFISTAAYLMVCLSDFCIMHVGSSLYKSLDFISHERPSEYFPVNFFFLVITWFESPIPKCIMKDGKEF